MSNNPLLPPPDMDDFEATMIREENPIAEPPRPEPDPDFPNPGRYENTRYNKPRRAKRRNNIIWTYIALGGYFAIAGFTGAFLGTLLANIL